MKKIIVLLSIFLFTITAYAGDNKSSDFIDNFAKIKTFKADFTQTNDLTDFGKAEYSGKVYIKMKDKALWDYTEPYTIWYLISNDDIQFYDELANQLIKVNMNNVKEQILLQVLTDITAVRNSFKISDIDKNTMRLIPLKDFGLKSIDITYKDNIITEMKSIDTVNNVSTIKFKNIKIDDKISNSVFKKKLPKDVEIFEEK